MACKIRMGEKEYTQEEFDSIPLVEKLEAILSSPDLERYVELGVTGLRDGAVFTTEVAVDPDVQTEYETALVDAADELTNTLNHAKEIQKKIRDVFGKHMKEDQVEMGLIMLDVMANAWAMKNNTIKEAYYLRYADVQDSGTADELLARIAQSKQELEETVIEEEVVEPVTEEVVEVSEASTETEVVSEEGSDVETVTETSPETETEVESEVVNESVLEDEDLQEENISAVLKETYDLLQRLLPEQTSEITPEELDTVTESDPRQDENITEQQELSTQEDEVLEEIMGELFNIPDDTDPEVTERVSRIKNLIKRVVGGSVKIKDVITQFGENVGNFIKKVSLSTIEHVESKPKEESNITSPQSPTIEDEVNQVVQDGEVLFETRAQAPSETLIEYEKIRSEAKANGMFMKAPNGKPTNLTEDQWIQVRSRAFKGWFGDWDGVSEYSDLSDKELVDLQDRYRELRDESRSSSDYNRYDQEYLKVLSVIEGGVNADHSLILDENGEPRVMYHGTNVEFDTFRLDATKANRNGNTDGIYFTSRRELAESVYGSNVKEVFLNIRNFALRSEYRPSAGAVNMLKDYIISEVSNDESYYNSKLNAFRNRGESDVASTSLKREMYMYDGYDGLVDGSITNGEVVVFNPNQIKSAVGNVGSFSEDTSNIYYQQGESAVQRAAVQAVGGNKFILHALKAPDIGSLVHEFMHVAEQDLDDMDLLTLENWSGHKRGTIEFKETVADGMVKFVSEDHPEISAINEVFAKVAKLLRSLYRGLVASPLDLKMDDSVRMVYARILGAEEAFSRRVNSAENQASEMLQAERASFIKDRHNDSNLKKYAPSQLQSGTKVVRKDGSIGIVGIDDLSGTTAKDRKDGILELLSYPTLKDVGILLQSKNKPQSSLKNKKKVVPSCT